MDRPSEFVPGGRLTLTQGSSVTSADVTGAGTIYYEPHLHNRIPIWDGTKMRLHSFPASSVSLAVTLTSAKMYDVFAYWDGAKVRLGLSGAWTSATARADAVTTLAGLGHDGFVVNSLAYAGFGPKMGTHIARIYASGTNTTEDSVTKRYVSNRYNQVVKGLFTCPGYVDDNTNTTYTTTSATYVAANGGTGSKIQFISDGWNTVNFGFAGLMTVPAVQSGLMGIGVDSTTSAKVCILVNNALTTSIAGTYPNIVLSEGYHAADLLVCVTGGTLTIYADIARLGSSADPPSTYLNATLLG